MHLFAAAVPPIRAASSATYGISTPSQPLVDHKKASMMPAARLPGRVAHAVIPVAHPVAPVPVPVPAPATKMQPQLQHLPRFQPPSFEGADGLIPCPDSPGSTPRGDEEFSREEESVTHSIATSVVGASTQNQKEASLEVLPEAIEETNRAPFPVGSFVEYKSRSSGHWILAKVEAYEEVANSYKLDVQPHAHPDRVRHRQPHSAAMAMDHSSQDPEFNTAGDRNTKRERNAAHERSGRDRDSSRDAVTARERDVVRESDLGQEYDSHERNLGWERDVARADFDVAGDGGQEMVGPSNVEALGQVTALMPSSYPTFTPPTSENVQQTESFKDTSAVGSDFNSYGAPERLSEVEVLKQQVALLHAEKSELQDCLRQEKSLKDRYFSELCVCHEQLQRLRGSTPR